ncbi:MAG: hypothetical protein R6V62_03275 [Candidatus Fermentibacteraceae bacterium]
MEKRLVLLLSPLFLVLFSCGEPQARGPASPEDGWQPVIAVTDTIGVETGDEKLTFGFITAVGMNPGGNVAVLDAQKATLQVFSPSGVELFSMGGFGPGPGEFQFPMAMAVLPDGYAVSDLMGGKIVFFDENGVFQRELTGFFPTPPFSIAASTPGGVTGFSMRMETGGDGAPRASMILATWRDSSEPSVVFHSIPVPMDGGRMMSRPEFEITPGLDGSVYISEKSDSLLQVLGFSPDGDTIFSVSEPFERTPKSEEELAEESMSISLRISNGESTLDRTRSRDEHPYRTVVNDIGVDSLGRVWLEMGHTGQTFFRVYPPDGGSFTTVVPENPEWLARADYSITPFGAVASEPDPLDWPKVYLLDLPEGNGAEQ